MVVFGVALSSLQAVHVRPASVRMLRHTIDAAEPRDKEGEPMHYVVGNPHVLVASHGHWRITMRAEYHCSEDPYDPCHSADATFAC